MSATSTSEPSKKKSQPKTKEEIMTGFQNLRCEQRLLSNKLTELQSDLQEHRLVIETLSDLDGDRKCFKLVGGILCERTVKEVLPQVKENQEQLAKVIDFISNQIVVKGAEINAYKDEHNIILESVDDARSSGGDSKSVTRSTPSVLAS